MKRRGRRLSFRYSIVTSRAAHLRLFNVGSRVAVNLARSSRLDKRTTSKQHRCLWSQFWWELLPLPFRDIRLVAVCFLSEKQRVNQFSGPRTHPILLPSPGAAGQSLIRPPHENSIRELVHRDEYRSDIRHNHASLYGSSHTMVCSSPASMRAWASCLIVG